VPFGDFVDTAPNFGGEIPYHQNANFWGINRRFQAKWAKYVSSYYQNYSIDFSQIWHNYRDHQVVIVGGPNERSTIPRWRTAAIWKKKLNSHISATV